MNILFMKFNKKGLGYFSLLPLDRKKRPIDVEKLKTEGSAKTEFSEITYRVCVYRQHQFKSVIK